MEQTKYLAACIQPDLPWDCRTREDVMRHLNDWIRIIDGVLDFHASYLPVKLFVFPELSLNPEDLTYWHDYTLKEQGEAIGIEIPGVETDLLTEVCKKYDIYIVAGSSAELDPKYPDVLFNTTPIIGPTGILAKYRKINTFIPFCTYASPADFLPEYEEELWPVAKTPIGNIGVANCYDWIFPETTRSLTMNGAEILARVSAYMEPWGATPPMDWWTVVNRCRALENIAYVVASGTGITTNTTNAPGIIWGGPGQVIDWDGRVLAQAQPGDGERITVGPIDVDMLRWVRKTQLRHVMPAHMRMEAYPCYGKAQYPVGLGSKQFIGNGEDISKRLSATIAESKRKLWDLG